MRPVYKILIFGPSPDAVSGVSTHLNQLFASSLAGFFSLGHFQVGSEGRCENRLQRIARLIFSPCVLIFVLLRLKPQIVHINTSMDKKAYWRDLIYFFIAHLFDLKIVYQKHGGELPQDFFRGNRFLTGLLRWVISTADVVVVLASVELKAYTDFAPKARIRLIPNAIDTATLSILPLISKGNGPLHLVYLGRFAENKGIFTILEAFSVIILTGRSMRLTFAGGGPAETELKTLAATLGISEHVHFAGPLFDSAKDELWKEGHVFIFPTYHREGLPYALLEAMAAGAVPVTTRVAAIPDVMQDEVHGLFVEPKDAQGLAKAIARLDDDRALLARMAEAGRARVLEAYTVDRLARDFQNLYNSLLEKA